MRVVARVIVIVVGVVVAAGCGGARSQPTAPVPVADAPPDAPPADPPAGPGDDPDPALDHFDVFGSKAVTRADVIARAAPAVSRLFAALADDQDIAPIRAELVAAVEAMAPLAYADLSIITYFGDKPGTYVTLDLVDEADRAARMRFAPAPTGSQPDPDGLLALWREYEQAMWPVLRAAHGVDPSPCPAWHCIFFGDPSLIRFRDAFEARVPAHEAELVRVLRGDADDADRAAAAFLLAHLDDGDRVVALELGAFDDPSPLVRNNAMRVVALIAQHHPEIDIPLAPVLAALRRPTTTDRNKALAILDGLARDPDRAAAILADARPLLEELADLIQPNNRDYARQILAAGGGAAD